MPDTSKRNSAPPYSAQPPPQPALPLAFEGGTSEAAAAVDALLQAAEKTRNADAAKAAALCDDALHRAREIGYSRGIAHSLTGLANFAIVRCRFSEATDLLGEAERLFTAPDDRAGLADVYCGLGSLDKQRGKLREALAHYEKSLALCTALGDTYRRSTVLLNLGSAYGQMGEYRRSLDCFQESLSAHTELGDAANIALSLMGCAVIYEKIGDYARSIEMHYQCLRTFEAFGNRHNAAKSLLNIANIHATLGEHERAVELYRQSYTRFVEVGDLVSQSGCLDNIGETRFLQHRYAEAISAIEESYRLSEACADQRGMMFALNRLGKTHHALGNAELAADFFRSSLALSRSIGDQFNEATNLLGLGRLLADQGEAAAAIETLSAAQALFDRADSKPRLFEAHGELAKVYESTGETAKALEHYKRYHTLERDVYNTEKEQDAKRLMVQFDLERAQQGAEMHRLKNVELAQALRKVEEANRLKTELLGIAAHDLQNPLQSIMGFAELILEGETTPTPRPSGEVVRMTQHIRSASERMLKLIVDLLQTAAESSHLELRRTPIDLSLLVREVAETFRAVAGKKRQTLLLDIDADAFVPGDRDRLRDVLENLISNAVKYSPSGGNISVGCRRIANDAPAAKRLQLRVKDEGQGLSEDDMKKLFGKFQRLSAKPTGGESSTGLGLSIVKHLIELHGGKVWAESEGLGKGSTFIVELPAMEAH